jgi:hypothetical protein
LNGVEAELRQQRLQELGRRDLRLVQLRDDDVLFDLAQERLDQRGLAEPISPVITTNPSVNQIVDSMYAFARSGSGSDTGRPGPDSAGTAGRSA